MVPAYGRVQDVLQRFHRVSQQLHVTRSAADFRQVALECADDPGDLVQILCHRPVCACCRSRPWRLFCPRLHGQSLWTLGKANPNVAMQATSFATKTELLNAGHLRPAEYWRALSKGLDFCVMNSLA